MALNGLAAVAFVGIRGRGGGHGVDSRDDDDDIGGNGAEGDDLCLVLPQSPLGGTVCTVRVVVVVEGGELKITILMRARTLSLSVSNLRVLSS